MFDIVSAWIRPKLAKRKGEREDNPNLLRTEYLTFLKECWNRVTTSLNQGFDSSEGRTRDLCNHFSHVVSEFMNMTPMATHFDQYDPLTQLTKRVAMPNQPGKIIVPTIPHQYALYIPCTIVPTYYVYTIRVV